MLGLTPYGVVQTLPYERTFPQSKAIVEKTLEEWGSFKAGRLPILDGFADLGDRSLDDFQRGYYKCAVEVTSTPSGGSVVRVSAKITAWYADPGGSKSGYQALPSNGRLETDFLDRLEEALGKTAVAKSSPTPAQSTPAEQPLPVVTDASPTASSTPSAGGPNASSKASANASSPFRIGTSATVDLATRQAALPDKHLDELNLEAKNLEEILHNQSHPNNLVAVKQSNTPVFANASEGGKVLFRATSQDEFELLDMNDKWVHVRISGISRGWLLRSSVEMPEGFESTTQSKSSPADATTRSVSSDKAPFQVENEQIASFPGSWAPLAGKTVKIISVQEAKGQTDSKAKLEFAKSLFNREYVELARDSSTAAGVVVVFDAEDGGMMATTLPVLAQWKSGTLSDQAMWHRCYFDPPELFRSSPTP
jgi:hypothetical protein